jgi:2-succinyl-6-hydroxy-2,4-cyclohexadiene-1-carboxylate synthase
VAKATSSKFIEERGTERRLDLCARYAHTAMSSLHVTSYGSGPLLVACHGFTQTASSWRTLTAGLQDSHTIVALDLPGHGGSSSVEANLDETASLIAEITRGNTFCLLGYSLGARVALTTALAGTRGLERSILISGTAGIADDALRTERRERDNALADAIETQNDVPAFLEQWLNQPMFATLSPDQAGSAERYENTARGLASSLRLSGTGTQEPSWDRLSKIETPVHLISGAYDPRFVTTNTHMVRHLARGSFHIVPGAGHAVHLEQPDYTRTLISALLAT